MKIPVLHIVESIYIDDYEDEKLLLKVLERVRDLLNTETRRVFVTIFTEEVKK